MYAHRSQRFSTASEATDVFTLSVIGWMNLAHRSLWGGNKPQYLHPEPSEFRHFNKKTSAP